MTDKREVENIVDLGDLLSSIVFEKLAHGHIRQGFVVGWTIIAISMIGMLVWLHFHPDLSSSVTLAGCWFIAGVAVIGTMVQTNTDLADQEAGLYPKNGSGWNLWCDNYIFNRLAQFGQLLVLLACACGTFYFAVGGSVEGFAVANKTQQKTAAATAAKPQTGHSVAVRHAHPATRHSPKHAGHASH